VAIFLALGTLRRLWGVVFCLALGDEDNAFELLFLVFFSFLPFFSHSKGCEKWWWWGCPPPPFLLTRVRDNELATPEKNLPTLASAMVAHSHA
jgi:hypothetical protein